MLIIGIVNNYVKLIMLLISNHQVDGRDKSKRKQFKGINLRKIIPLQLFSKLHNQ